MIRNDGFSNTPPPLNFLALPQAATPPPHNFLALPVPVTPPAHNFLALPAPAAAQRVLPRPTPSAASDESSTSTARKRKMDHLIDLQPFEIVLIDPSTKIPSTESLDTIATIEDPKERCREHTKRLARSMGIPVNNHIPYEIIQKSINQTVRASTSKPPASSPFVNELVIFSDDYVGELDLINGIREKDFKELSAFYDRLIEGKTNISVVGSPDFIKNLRAVFVQILSTEVGRELFNRLVNCPGKTLTFKATTPTYPSPATKPNETFDKVTIFMNFELVLFTTRSRSGKFSPTKATLPSITFHEMVHALHIFNVGSADEFLKMSQRCPLHGKEYDDYEEELTVGHLENREDPSAWKKRSGKWLCENDLRIANRSYLPLRYGHHGIQLPPKKIDPKDTLTGDYFFQACREGYVDEVKRLISLGVDPEGEIFADDECTPLFIAAQNGRFNVVNLLLEHGADHRKIPNGGLTFAHYCVRSGDVSMLNNLIARNLINIFASDLVFPLIPYAIKKLKNSCESMVLCLIKHGALFNRCAADNTSALHVACEITHVPTFHRLLELNYSLHRFNPLRFDQMNGGGLLPIHVAFMKGNLDVLTILFTPDITYFNANEKNWMFYAAVSNDIPTVDFLLNFDRAYFLQDVADSNGDTVIDYAFSGKTKTDKKRPFIEYLRKLGFQLHNKHLGDYLRLYVTASQPVREKILIDVYTRIPIDEPVISGQRLLDWAIGERDHELADSALVRGAKLNPPVSKEYPYTPLHRAVLNNDADMVYKLLFWGAEKQAKDFEGKTALELLIAKFVDDKTFDPEIFRLLQTDPFANLKAVQKVASPNIANAASPHIAPSSSSETG